MWFPTGCLPLLAYHLTSHIRLSGPLGDAQPPYGKVPGCMLKKENTVRPLAGLALRLARINVQVACIGVRGTVQEVANPIQVVPVVLIPWLSCDMWERSHMLLLTVASSRGFLS